MNEGHQGHRNNNADDDNGQVGRVHGVGGFHLSIFLKVDAGRVGRSGDYGAGLHARAIAKKNPARPAGSNCARLVYSTRSRMAPAFSSSSTLSAVQGIDLA